MPGYAPTTTTYSQGNKTWLRSDYGLLTGQTVTLSIAAFTSGTHYPNGFIPSGIALGKITASGEYGPYDNAAVDGRQTMTGHLLNDEAVVTGQTKLTSSMLWQADVDESKLPTTHGVDSAGKTDVAAHIRYS
jgi:hypothetical protein